jgi:hypothetical protein
VGTVFGLRVILRYAKCGWEPDRKRKSLAWSVDVAFPIHSACEQLSVVNAAVFNELHDTVARHRAAYSQRRDSTCLHIYKHTVTTGISFTVMYMRSIHTRQLTREDVDVEGLNHVT